jgi:putative transposase
VLDWCYGFYHHGRPHSSGGMVSPINYENTVPPPREAA